MVRLLTVQALGLYSVAEGLGLSRLWVRAGLLCYAIATFLLYIPATIDGFVTPFLRARCSFAPSECAAGLSGSIAFGWAAILAFTNVALAVQAIGLLCWSVVLAQGPGWRR